MNHTLQLAAKAIDAKCRTDDHYLMISTVRELQSMIADTVEGDRLLTELLFSESGDPMHYLRLLVDLEQTL